MKKEKKKKRSIRSKLIILGLILALVLIYARYIGTAGIGLREYNIKSSDIPVSFDGFSIVHFSDLELGSTFNVDNLKTLVKKINSLNPDIVVFTGDLIKEKYKLTKNDTKKIIKYLSDIDPLIDKYYIRGDEDVKNKSYQTIMNSSNFKDVINKYELIYYKGLSPIVLYGLDSLIKNKQDFENTFSYRVEETDPYGATYSILLAHEPDTIKLLKDYNISLMLSGHSHNSQINIPYLKKTYKIKGATSYYDEEYEVYGTKLFISNGLGTEKIKMRLFSKPSISIYRLYSE